MHSRIQLLKVKDKVKHISTEIAGKHIKILLSCRVGLQQCRHVKEFIIFILSVLHRIC